MKLCVESDQLPVSINHRFNNIPKSGFGDFS